jgi:hypothetical protein
MKDYSHPPGSLWIFDAQLIWPSSARPSICDESGYLLRHVEPNETFLVLEFGDPRWSRVICNRTLGFISTTDMKACKKLM